MAPPAGRNRRWLLEHISGLGDGGSSDDRSGFAACAILDAGDEYSLFVPEHIAGEMCGWAQALPSTLSAGYQHSVAVTRDGEVITWGNESDDQVSGDTRYVRCDFLADPGSL